MGFAVLVMVVAVVGWWLFGRVGGTESVLHSRHKARQPDARTEQASFAVAVGRRIRPEELQDKIKDTIVRLFRKKDLQLLRPHVEKLWIDWPDVSYRVALRAPHCSPSPHCSPRCCVIVHTHSATAGVSEGLSA